AVPREKGKEGESSPSESSLPIEGRPEVGTPQAADSARHDDVDPDLAQRAFALAWRMPWEDSPRGRTPEVRKQIWEQLVPVLARAIKVNDLSDEAVLRHGARKIAGADKNAVSFVAGGFNDGNVPLAPPPDVWRPDADEPATRPGPGRHRAAESTHTPLESPASDEANDRPDEPEQPGPEADPAAAQASDEAMSRVLGRLKLTKSGRAAAARATGGPSAAESLPEHVEAPPRTA
ncbi:hypothetical protein, partial [Saccharopolyspora griseoalba]